MAINLAEVPFKELKKATAALNGSGLLDSKIKTVGVKKEDLLNEFCDAVEKLEEAGEVEEIPEIAFDFYNDLASYEEGDEDEDVEEIEEDEDVEDIEDEDEDVEDTPPPRKKKPKPKPKQKPKPAKKPAPTRKKKKVAEVTETEEEEEFTEGRTRLATVKMTAKVEEGKLTIGFEGQKIRKFKMPSAADKPKLKLLLTKALEFAVEQGATIGQQKAVRKAFTSAGYYMTK